MAPRTVPLTVTANGTNGTTNGADSVLPETQMVIVHDESDSQKLLASALAAQLDHATGRAPETGTLSEVNASGKLCIVISELHKPLLSSLTSEQFSALQKVLTAAEGCLWAVRGAYDNSTNPDANMILGMSRTIRSETAMKFATLDLDDATRLSDDDTAKAILKVFTAAFGSSSSNSSELEFMERAGAFYTPRIVNDNDMNELVHRETGSSTLESIPFGAQGRLLKLALSTPGALDTLHFIDDPTAGTLWPRTKLRSR